MCNFKHSKVPTWILSLSNDPSTYRVGKEIAALLLHKQVAIFQPFTINERILLRYKFASRKKLLPHKFHTYIYPIQCQKCKCMISIVPITVLWSLYVQSRARNWRSSLLYASLSIFQPYSVNASSSYLSATSSSPFFLLSLCALNFS